VSSRWKGRLAAILLAAVVLAPSTVAAQDEEPLPSDEMAEAADVPQQADPEMASEPTQDQPDLLRLLQGASALEDVFGPFPQLNCSTTTIGFIPVIRCDEE
jgi:hypothetical protein